LTATAGSGCPDELAQSPVTDSGGVTGRLSSWLAGLDGRSIPTEVREWAAHLLLDGVACALVGAQLPWSRVAVEAVASLEGTGTTPIVGWGRHCLRPPRAC